MTTIHPCLPKHLLDSLKKDPVISVANSFTFQSQFEDFRRKVVLRGDAPERVTINSRALFKMTDFSHFFDNDSFCSMIQGISQFREIDHKTFLHVAAFNEDVPATYELIRLGIDIDRRDKDGATALFVALAKLVLWRFIPKVLSNGEPLSYTTNQIKCLVRVVTLLVEQHADVNGGAYGFIPVSLAAMAAQWDIVQLLIKHGASTEDFACLPEDEPRFRVVISSTPRLQPRPPCPCPCWSGKFLSVCHAAGAQPYPDDFLCGCGTTKTHKDCCKKRGLVFEESWNTRRGCITSMQVRVGIDIDDSLVPSGLKERYAKGSETMRSFIKGMTVEGWEDCGAFLTDGDTYMTVMKSTFTLVGKDPKKEVDPAFWYALMKAKFVPRSAKEYNTMTENYMQRELWNNAIDEYILTQKDPRSRLEIELEAKIGAHGGPLHRRCEGVGCQRLEGHDIAQLKKCHCEKVVYCSEECQHSHWPEHKGLCRTHKHPIQLLRSQRNIEQVAAVFVATFLS